MKVSWVSFSKISPVSPAANLMLYVRARMEMEIRRLIKARFFPGQAKGPVKKITISILNRAASSKVQKFEVHRTHQE